MNECPRCGGQLVRKPYMSVWVCEDCGKEYYYEKDFGYEDDEDRK